MSPPSPIQLFYLPGCPHAEPARVLLRRCLARLGLELSVEENVGDYPSPTIMIHGVDVMGSSGISGQACRIDVPTEEKLMAALQKIRG
jgi:hypothetical protein